MHWNHTKRHVPVGRETRHAFHHIGNLQFCHPLHVNQEISQQSELVSHSKDTTNVLSKRIDTSEVSQKDAKIMRNVKLDNEIIELKIQTNQFWRMCCEHR